MTQNFWMEPLWWPAMKRIRNDKGLALIITLLVIVLLTTLILQFDFSSRTDLLAATNFRDGTKAVFLAQSGLAAGKAVLRDDSLHSGQYDAFNELWAAPFPPYPVGDGTVTVSIQDEGGKLNLNDLVDPNGRQSVPKKVGQMKRLFELLEVDPNLVDGIVDWLDQNDDPYSSYGAEEDYYSRLSQPYHCKNGKLSVLSELHMVRGITDLIYEKLSPYLTVNSGQRVGQTQGPISKTEGPININTAEAVVLQTLPIFEKDKDEYLINQDLAQKIMEARPFKQESDLDGVSGMKDIAQKIRPYYVTGSNYFTIVSSGNVGGFVKTIHATVERNGTKINTVYWKME
jgi:general secretion pathway protein K